MSDTQEQKLTVTIAGASGFIGKNLIQVLLKKYNVIALSRQARESTHPGLIWRQSDLFSAGSTREALQDADIAIYLVHSMQTSSRLFQGRFEDTDLLLADNFARACAYHQVNQIIYLSGLWPEEAPSPHLLSRHEVELVFQSSSIPSTILRAGMVVGPEGSSFEILHRLVKRLPFMILPAWTQNPTQAVSLDDLLRVVNKAIDNHNFFDRVIDVVNGESLTYKHMIQQMAEVLNKKIWMQDVPISWSKFSKLWVSKISQTSSALVSPLIDSLHCKLPQNPPEALISDCIQDKSFKAMASHSLSTRKQATLYKSLANRQELPKNTVRSIQRLPTLPDYNAAWISEQYMNWLQGFFLGMISTKTNAKGDRIRFLVPVLNLTLLELQYIAGYFDEDRRKFFVVGGLLCKRSDTGWLEFRQIANKRFTLSALHEFVPRLPWFLYCMTQAQVHAFVMFAFGHALQPLEDHWRNSQYS